MHVCSNKWRDPLQIGDNQTNLKNEIYMSASWYSAASILFNLWSPWVLGGHNRVKHFYICFNGENLWKSFQKPTEPKRVQIYWQGDLMAIKKINIACVHRRNISQYDLCERCGPWVSCRFYFHNSSRQTVIHSLTKLFLDTYSPSRFTSLSKIPLGSALIWLLSRYLNNSMFHVNSLDFVSSHLLNKLSRTQLDLLHTVKLIFFFMNRWHFSYH
jgi:hypothetical protein